MSVDKAAIRSLLRWADNERGRFVSFEDTLAHQIDNYGANLPETTWRKIVENNKGLFALARRYTNDVKKGEVPLLLEEIKGEKTNVVTKEGLRGFTTSGEVSVSREGNEEIESSTGLYRVGARGETGERTRVGERVPAFPREEQDYYESPAVLDKQGYDRYLSQKQKQFFKYSQARNEQGQLLVLYHGSPDTFFTFENNPGKNSGTPTGRHYFTPDKEYAQKYAVQTQAAYPNGSLFQQSVRKPTGKVGEARGFYLNMEKPLDLTNITTEDIEKAAKFFVQGAYGKETPEIIKNQLEKTIKDTAKLEGLPLENMVLFLTGLTTNNDYLTENGYDGVIHHDYKGRNLEYSVVRPNQIKLTTNLDPSESEDIRYDTEGERESLALIPESKVSILHNARKKLARAAMANRVSLTMKGAFLYGGQQWVTSASFIARFYDKVSGKIEGTPRDENNIAWVEDFADFSENISRTLPKWKKVATEKGSKVEISLKELAEAIAAARRDGGQRLYANINGVFFSAVEMEAVLSSIHEPSVYVFQKDNGRVLWAEGANGEAVIMGRSGDRIEVSQIVYETKGSETTAVDKNPKVGQNINVNGGDNEERIQRRRDSRGEEDTGKHGEEQGESRDTNEVSTVPLGDSTNSEPNAEADSSTAIRQYLGLREESQKYLEEQGFTYFDFYSPTSEDF